jgi:SAM-dependent methyltransferase
MLVQAHKKALDKKLDILYLNQDMTSFELYGTVDVALCLLDSINYILKPDMVKRMFSLVNNYLNPGGLFIFDINSEYKLEKILGDNVFYSVEDDITYIWQNTFNTKKRITTFDLTFFMRQDQNYSRFDESHREKAYSVGELEKYLVDAGLKILEVTDGMSFKKVRTNSERIVFTCLKP